MRDKKEFYSILQGIDGRAYSEYARIVGDFDFARYVLKISQIQPEGTDTLFVVRVPQIIAAFPPHTFNSPVRRTALEDLLTREVARQIDLAAQIPGRTTGAQRLSIATPLQKILPRASMVVTDEHVEARLYVRLPSVKGRVDTESACEVFFDQLPQVVNQSLIYCNLDEAKVEAFVDRMEDADQIRQLLPTQGLIGFIGEECRPGRLTGSDLPAPGSAGFTVQPELVKEIDVPNAGKVRGVGIPSGLTVILGGESSGRADLMHTLAAGIYNHIPGDGRETSVTVPDAVYIPAEPGRSVQRVDISPFFHEIPGAQVKAYTSASAPAAAAQAASVVEALEVGARVLLLDESDSAASFLARDARLAALLPSDAAANVPLSALARALVDDLGVSIVVAGCSAVSDFLTIADTVLCIENRAISDVTAKAKALGLPSTGTGRKDSLPDKFRWLVPAGIDPALGRLDDHIDAPDAHHLAFGRCNVDLTAVRQLADRHQTATIGQILYYAKLRYLDEGRPIREVLDLVDRDLSTEGLECLTRELRGDLARPRRYEIAAALNRLDTLRISHISE